MTDGAKVAKVGLPVEGVGRAENRSLIGPLVFFSLFESAGEQAEGRPKGGRFGLREKLPLALYRNLSRWSVRLSRGALRFVGCLDFVCCVWHCSGHGRYQAPGRARERASRALGSGARAWTTRRP